MKELNLFLVKNQSFLADGNHGLIIMIKIYLTPALMFR